MRSWKVLDVKTCMNCMLRGEAFDEFLLAEASIIAGVSYVIDGHLTEEFYTGENWRRCVLRGSAVCGMGKCARLCFDMIKGRRTPRSFCFVFLASREQTEDFLKQGQLIFRPEEIGNLSLNLRFYRQELTVICPVTRNAFTLRRHWSRPGSAGSAPF